MKNTLFIYHRSLPVQRRVARFVPLVVRARVPFRACRIYLLSAVALSAVIPALHIPVYPAAPVAVAPFVAPVESELVGTAEFVEPVMAAPVVGTLRALDWPRLLTDAMRMVYVGAVCVLFGWFIVRLVYIARLRRRARLTDCRGYVLAEHAAVGSVFLFCELSISATGSTAIVG